MAADEWKLCVDWLVQCKILPDDHRSTWPEAQAFDLAQTLRDGVLLCHLLNTLKPYSVDPKDFILRPQLSQFLCLKNIRTFLVTCEKIFGVDVQDLFDPPDLFEVQNFRKVLHTLSKLSKTELALKKGIKDFPPHNDDKDDKEEDIYGNLCDMAIHHDIEDNEELYDSVYQEEDDEIYEDLCSTRTQQSSQRTISMSELPKPVSRKDYCIKETVDTERNYVDALKMITQHFLKPLKSVYGFTLDHERAIFSHVEKLYEVHQVFHEELRKACLNDRSKIYTIFIKFKEKFIIYGEYCSNLPNAQASINELVKQNENAKRKIEECENEVNEGRFKLRDLLHLPMQRVLKYHLLLRELIKNTEKGSEDIPNLQLALEAMQDLSLYVNEVKRDNEALAITQEIQNSITDLQMPANTSLKNYGRLQKDGELKVKCHVDNKVKQRYIFLFDKVLLMGKSKGDSYSFKEAIVLAEYKVENITSFKDSVRRPEKWNCSFQVAKPDLSKSFTFFAKTEDIKLKWVEAINLALDNTQPAAGPNFIMTTFDVPTVCDICAKLLRGVFFQGYQDPGNNQCVHKECIGKKKPTKPDTKRPIASKSECYKAKVPYGLSSGQLPGRGRTPLKFEKDEIIEVLAKEGDWWRGCLLGKNIEGWFPAQLVEENRNLPKRQPSYLDWKPSGTGNKAIKTLPAPCPKTPDYINVPTDDFLQYDWYVGPLAREIAGEKLKHHPDGCFLVRDSENPQRKGNPALSIKFSGTVRHIKIEKNAEGMYYMAEAKYFRSLPELVDYYQRNSLMDSFPEVNTNLMYPYKTALKNPPATNGLKHLRVAPPPRTDANSKGTYQQILSYVVAVYDYAATATSQIDLRTGDRVAVLSKTGNDKGWWKGEHCATHKMGYFPFAYVKEDEES